MVDLLHDMVELIRLEPGLKLDIRYATEHNFVGRAVYSEPKAFLQRPVAEALIRAHHKLGEHGLGLVIFDGYRPWSVTKLFWEVTAPENRRFVADPASGSVHNRGCAVDLSLFSLKNGNNIEMPSEFDEMSERSSIEYTGGSDGSRQMRDLLWSVMESERFKGYSFEWWHFNHEDWERYPIMDLQFSSIMS